MANKLYVLFYQTRGHFSKKYNLCPHVQLETVVWLFYGEMEGKQTAPVNDAGGKTKRQKLNAS